MKTKGYRREIHLKSRGFELKMPTSPQLMLSRPLYVLQGLFNLSRSVWLPIVSMSIVAVSAFFFNEWSVRQLGKNTTQLTSLMSLQSELTDFCARLTDAESGQRGYLLSFDPAYLAPYERAIEAFPTIDMRLRELARSDGLFLNHVQKLDVLRNNKISELQATVVLAQRGQIDSALTLMRTGAGRVAMDAIRSESSVFFKEITDKIVASQAEAQRNSQLSRVAFVALTFLALILVFVAVRLLIRDYWRQYEARSIQNNERHRLEEVVRNRTIELSNLTTYLQSVAEKEKSDLARNLHDELGGLLTVIKMDLAWLQGRAAASDQEAISKLDAISSGIDSALNVKRRVVENLRPSLLDHFGLPTALLAYFDETCEKAGLRCTTVIPEELEGIPDPLAIALFRVSQESLTNIIRHAHAKSVCLTFKADINNYTLEITDDGIGIASVKVLGAASHGLSGMRHRIANFNGKFDITDNPPHGTRLYVVVPRTLA